MSLPHHHAPFSLLCKESCSLKCPFLIICAIQFALQRILLPSFHPQMFMDVVAMLTLLLCAPLLLVTDVAVHGAFLSYIVQSIIIFYYPCTRLWTWSSKSKFHHSHASCVGLAKTVYIYTVYVRIFGDFPARNTVYVPYIYSVGQPCSCVLLSSPSQMSLHTRRWAGSKKSRSCQILRLSLPCLLIGQAAQ